jgi:hypothetical protein
MCSLFLVWNTAVLLCQTRFPAYLVYTVNVYQVPDNSYYAIKIKTFKA